MPRISADHLFQICYFHAKPKGLHSLALMEPCVSLMCATLVLKDALHLFLFDTLFPKLKAGFWSHKFRCFDLWGTHLAEQGRAALNAEQQVWVSRNQNIPPRIYLGSMLMPVCFLKGKVILPFKQLGQLYFCIAVERQGVIRYQTAAGFHPALVHLSEKNHRDDCSRGNDQRL